MNIVYCLEHDLPVLSPQVKSPSLLISFLANNEDEREQKVENKQSSRQVVIDDAGEWFDVSAG